MSQRIVDEIENRRGLVLGLTLAELLLLLLFLLLIALAWRMVNLEKQVEAQRSRAEKSEAASDAFKPLMDELTKRGALTTASIKEFVSKIGTVEILERKVSALQKSNSELMKENAGIRDGALGRAISAASQIDPNDPPATLVRAVQILMKLGEDVTPDQIKSLSEMNLEQAKKIEQIKSLTEMNREQAERIETLGKERDKYKEIITGSIKTGNGLTYPSCWKGADGKIEYIFDIMIRDNGFVVTDATPRRVSDSQMSLLEPFQRSVLIDKGQFLRATTKLFEWSKNEECRFYSIVRDGTGPTSKQQYKELRAAVESHFYVLILNSGLLQEHQPSNQPTNVPMGGPYIPVPPGYNPR